MSKVPTQRKVYLGDGVYAEFDGWNIWLYTSNGERESEKIAVEPKVFAALHDYAKVVWWGDRL